MASSVTRIQPLPISEELSDAAGRFIDIHLNAIVKRDRALWFAERPNEQFAQYELVSALKHGRAAIGAGIKGLEEAGAIELAMGAGRHVWKLTSDEPTRQLLSTIARYWREQPKARHNFVAQGNVKKKSKCQTHNPTERT